MTQKIYPDGYGIDTWDPATRTTFNVHLVDALDWPSITGEPVPPSPVSIETYKSLGLPWFALLDSKYGDLPVSPILAGVQPLLFD